LSNSTGWQSAETREIKIFMGRVLNLMAFVIFATTLFMRSVDPVIPQIASGLNVTPTTAALLSTGFTLPYALVQPVLGALADMFSKTRLIAVCMLVVGITTIACGFATNFEMLMTLRVIAGIAAGGVFPIALAVAGDRVPVQQRQVAIGRLLFAAMTGNLLGASGAGVIGDVVGWRGVFFVTGAIDLVALAVAMPGFRSMNESPGRFDLSTFIPNYRAVFSNPLAKYCFGAVFIEALFLFGVFPYMAVLLREAGETHASIAGVVIAGFGIGGVIYTLMVAWLVAHVSEQRLMAAGGMVMGACLLVITLRMPWPIEFVNFMVMGFGFYLLHGCIQVYVTELAPSARGSATAGHSMFFFLGQAAGPVVYGAGLTSVGITPVLVVGAAALAVTGWTCALRLRRTSPKG
jgi:predicted MFS family arabinose efflux permease